jgi:hypothetical protein
MLFKCILGGGGQSEALPDGRFVVHAESLHPYLLAIEPVYYFLEIILSPPSTVAQTLDAGRPVKGLVGWPSGPRAYFPAKTA